MARVSREDAAAGKEIGKLPDVVDSARKESCRLDFRLFCETYFAHRFPLAWSDSHRKCIDRIQTTVLSGGLYAFAMPRKSGKTTLCEVAALWVLVFGHRPFVVLIGATDDAALELLQSVKIELETNRILGEDFPEVCFPVRSLEGESRRCLGQTLEGRRTRIVWTGDKVVLPTVPGSPASGAVVRTTGFTGRVRGMKYTLADGGTIRPSFVILDDPQTDESAGSPSQNAKRYRVVSKAVLGLSGPKVKISAVMPCTVIEPDDMVDRMLDRSRHPEWNGERTQLMTARPTNRGLWDRYKEVLDDALRAGRGPAEATEFYRENRAAMDAGAVVSWADNFNPDELSAVQYAMNLMLTDYESFQAEYQNEPLRPELGGDVKKIDPLAAAKRVSGCPRGVVPREASRLTAFVDVHGDLLYYCVAAWTEHFGGSVVDYGTWPRQNRAYFTKADAKPSLADVFPDKSITERAYAGLEKLVPEVFGRVYTR